MVGVDWFFKKEEGKGRGWGSVVGENRPGEGDLIFFWVRFAGKRPNIVREATLRSLALNHSSNSKLRRKA